MAHFVFILCTVTSLACGVLLLRAYGRTRTRLLLWSGLCFVGLSVNNATVFVDLAILPPEISLVPIRNLIALASLLVLITGFIWEGGHR